MNSAHNFRSYTVEVDFEGIKLPLPNIYRYITRDENGFIQAWRNRPQRDLTYGGFTGDGELPITLGHQNSDVEPVVRKYRRKRTNCIVSVFGIIPAR